MFLLSIYTILILNINWPFLLNLVLINVLTVIVLYLKIIVLVVKMVYKERLLLNVLVIMDYMMMDPLFVKFVNSLVKVVQLLLIVVLVCLNPID